MMTVWKNWDTTLAIELIPVTYEHPEPKASHLLGASEMHGSYIRHFRGFIKRIAVSPVQYDEIWGFGTCDGICSECPGDGVCYDTCNWNHWKDTSLGTCSR